MAPCDPCMGDLPVEVMVDILSRLPVKTTIHCKCVCKKWLDLVTDSYFADFQLSRSPAGFIIYPHPGILKWVEVKDEVNYHNLHHDPVTSLDLNLAPILKNTQILPVGSVNGLICLRQFGSKNENTYICNPITREYMILSRQQYYRQGYGNIVYCFGVGSLTGKYKVIRIYQKGLVHPDSIHQYRPGLSEADAYTLGTGQWRSLGHVPYWFYEPFGPFLNGHVHWTIGDRYSCQNICAFNFDNEKFELFPSPLEAMEESGIYFQRLGVLKGCLCRCDAYSSKLTVWVMKEYGIKKSWHKELVIEKGICPNVGTVDFYTTRPIESFKDGTILMSSCRNNLIVYCPWRKAFVDTELRKGPLGMVLAYSPSFHRLQNFKNERVHVF